jgi:isocitrate lyase
VVREPSLRGDHPPPHARQVVEQRGTIETDYTGRARGRRAFHARLRELFAERRASPPSARTRPGQAVAMKRLGIEGIYLGGWATSAKGSTTEDPGPDLASYPLSQVPDEAAASCARLLTADRNQQFARAPDDRGRSERHPGGRLPPFIIADADTGHGGDAHVRNLDPPLRRGRRARLPHRGPAPGTKKCGHQGGKVLVASDEQIKRLNAARFQLDVMGVPGIIVARTDAEAATLLDGRGDERDQPFILGATNATCRPYKAGFLAVMRRFHDAGVDEITGTCSTRSRTRSTRRPTPGSSARGRRRDRSTRRARSDRGGDEPGEDVLDAVDRRFLEAWEAEAGLKTYGEAVAEAIAFRAEEGETLEMSVDEWRRSRATASWHAARAPGAAEMGLTSLGLRAGQDARGLLPGPGGIPYAIAKSLAAAPFADILWMETKTADLADAREFAEAIHAVFPTRCSPTTCRRRSTGTRPA